MVAGSRKTAASSCPPTTKPQSRERQKLYDYDSFDSIEKPRSRPSVQITFVALGVSSLLPWNAIVTVLPFFLDRLSGTPFHDSFASWLSFMFNGVGLLAMGLATWAGGRFTNPSSFSFSIITLIFLFAFLAIVPFLTLSAPVFFGITLFTSSLLASAGGFLQTSTITLAPQYGSSAIAAYMAGSALSAVGVSALQVVTAYTSTGITLPDMDSASWSATICFMASAMVLGMTLLSYRALRPNDDEFSQLAYPKGLCVELPPSERTQLLRRRSHPSLLRAHQAAPVDSYKPRYGCNFSIFYGGIVTLCLFPAITATIEPISTNTNPLVFNALHFLVFNLADLAGRSLASIRFFSPTSSTFLVTYSLARTLFIPFFLVCNVAGLSSPALITSDAVCMLGLLLLGLTYGHSSTLALVAVSEDEDPNVGGRATRLAQFWMMAGIVAGGGASFGVRAIL